LGSDTAFEGGSEVLEDGFEAGFFLLVGGVAPEEGEGFVFFGFVRGGEFEEFLGLEAFEPKYRSWVLIFHRRGAEVAKERRALHVGR
jgi:hypothetical protein